MTSQRRRRRPTLARWVELMRSRGIWSWLTTLQNRHLVWNRTRRSQSGLSPHNKPVCASMCACVWACLLACENMCLFVCLRVFACALGSSLCVFSIYSLICE